MREFEIHGAAVDWFRDGDFGVKVCSWLPQSEEKPPPLRSSGPPVHMLSQVMASGNRYSYAIVTVKGANLAIFNALDGLSWGEKIEVRDINELIDLSYWTPSKDDPSTNEHSTVFKFSSDDRALLVDNMAGLKAAGEDWDRSFQITVTMNPIRSYRRTGDPTQYGPDFPSTAGTDTTSLFSAMASPTSTFDSTFTVNAGGITHVQRLTHETLGTGTFDVDESPSEQRSVAFNIFVLPDRPAIDTYLKAMNQDTAVFE